MIFESIRIVIVELHNQGYFASSAAVWIAKEGASISLSLPCLTCMANNSPKNKLDIFSRVMCLTC